MSPAKVTAQLKDDIETIRLPVPKRLIADLDDYRRYLDRDGQGRTQTSRQHIVCQLLDDLFTDKGFRQWQEQQPGSGAAT